MRAVTITSKFFRYFCKVIHAARLNKVALINEPVKTTPKKSLVGRTRDFLNTKFWIFCAIVLWIAIVFCVLLLGWLKAIDLVELAPLGLGVISFILMLTAIGYNIIRIEKFIIGLIAVGILSGVSLLFVGLFCSLFYLPINVLLIVIVILLLVMR